LEKRDKLKDYVAWADKQGVIKKVDSFLQGLDSESRKTEE